MTRREIEWKPMRSKGVIVPAEVLAAAWGKWSPQLGYGRLGGLICQEFKGAGYPDPDWWRIADRMIQKARKAGVIRLGAGRVWGWVE